MLLLLINLLSLTSYFAKEVMPSIYDLVLTVTTSHIVSLTGHKMLSIFLKTTLNAETNGGSRLTQQDQSNDN